MELLKPEHAYPAMVFTMSPLFIYRILLPSLKNRFDDVSTNMPLATVIIAAVAGPPSPENAQALPPTNETIPLDLAILRIVQTLESPK